MRNWLPLYVLFFFVFVFPFPELPSPFPGVGSQTETVRALLSAGASEDVKTKTGLTPLDVAARAGHTSVVSVLKGVKLNI